MPKLGGIVVTAKEVAILEAARVVVTEWFRDHDRRSFRETLLARAKPVLSHYGLTAADYPAFRRVANLIRTGQGRPESRPAPLIAATRDHPDFVVTAE